MQLSLLWLVNLSPLNSHPPPNKVQKIRAYELNHMGVSKTRGTPKWMVYNGKPELKMDDMGGKTPIFGNTHMVSLNKALKECEVFRGL